MSKLIVLKNKIFIFSVIVILLIIFLVKFINGWLEKNKTPEKKMVAQQITLIAPPPPPPPPPEPEKVEPEIKEEVPEDVPETPPDTPQDEAPAGQDLGLDSDGGAGTDGFGLIGRKGGTGIGLGKAGHYEVTVKEKIVDLISSDEELRYLAYSGVITIWMNPSGHVEKYSIVLDDESPKVKKLLEVLLAKLSLDSGPPIEMADKGIKLKINSRI